MQNISRRVFIKGMAVAAVATAASTVLAGCNLPAIGGGVDEPVDAPVGQTITLKMVDNKDETVAVTILGCTVNSDTGYAALSVKVVNDTYDELTLATSGTSDQNLVITGKAYSPLKPNGDTVNFDSSTFTWVDNKNLLEGAGAAITGNTTATAGVSSKEGKLYFKPTAGQEDWTKIEVTVALYDANAAGEPYTFTINR